MRALCRMLLTIYATTQLSIAQNTGASDYTDIIAAMHAAENRGDLKAATLAVNSLIDRVSKNDPNNRLLPEAVSKLASLQQDQGRYSDAEHLFIRAIGMWQARPDAPSLQLATDLNNLGSLYLVIGQLDKAEAFLRQGLGLKLTLIGPNRPETALSYSNLASDLIEAGKYPEAEECAKKAVEVWQKGPDAKSQADLGYDTLALVALHRSDSGQALRFAELAASEYIRHAPPDRTRMIWYDHTLALARDANGDLSGAAEAYQDAIAVLKANSASRSPSRVSLLQDYASLLQRLGQKHQARNIQKWAERESADLLKGNSFQYSVSVNALR